jgi:hypothetical protein
MNINRKFIGVLNDGSFFSVQKYQINFMLETKHFVWHLLKIH